MAAFLSLTDTPSAYTAMKYRRVVPNRSESALSFSDYDRVSVKDYPGIKSLSEHGVSISAVTTANASTYAIDAAVASVVGTGKVLYIPSGEYVITKSIALNSNTYIEGDGPGETVLYVVHPSGIHAPAMSTPTTSSVAEFGVRDLTIDFSKCGSPSSDSLDIGIRIGFNADYMAFRYEIDNVTVRYAHTAVFAPHGFMGKVSRLTSYRCRNGVIHGWGTTTKYDGLRIVGYGDSSKDGTPLSVSGYEDTAYHAWPAPFEIKFSRVEIANFHRLWPSTTWASYGHGLVQAYYGLGLSLQGLYIHDCTVEGSTEASLIRIYNCLGFNLTGLYTADNTIKTTATSGEARTAIIDLTHATGSVYGVSVGGVHSVSGQERPSPDSYHMASGATNYASSIMIAGSDAPGSDGSHVAVSGSQIWPMKKASGSASTSEPSYERDSGFKNIVVIASDMGGEDNVFDADGGITIITGAKGALKAS